MIPSPVIRCLINDFEKIVGHLTLSPQRPSPHHKPTHVDFTLSAFNDKRHSSSCQSKFVKSSTKSLERQRKNTTFNNSLSLDLTKAVWRLSSFSSGKFCELRDYAYGQNLCVLYAKFPPPKAKRLQLVMPPTPQGRIIVFATLICKGTASLLSR